MSSTKELAIKIGQQREVDRCKREPLYFMSLYWTIKTMTGSLGGKNKLAPLAPRPFQTDLVNLFESSERMIVLKGRQIGFTKVVSAYLTWYAMVHPHSDIFYVSKNATEAAEAIQQIRNIGVAKMPQWMFGEGKFPKITNRAAKTIKFDNGSAIEIAAIQDGNPARGRTPTILTLDEFAYYPDQEGTLNSAEPAVDNGAKLFISSTSTGYDNVFAGLWLDSAEGKTLYDSRFYGWQSVPERDSAWFDGQMSSATTPTQRLNRAREHPDSPEDAFANAGRTVFDVDLIRQQDAEIQAETPKIGYLVENDDDRIEWVYDDDAALTIYRDKYETKGDVAIGADVAEGMVHGDYSAAVVLDSACEVCAVWHGRCDPRQFGEALYLLGAWYDFPLLAVEDNGFGNTTLAALSDMGYRKLYRRERTGVVPGASPLAELGWRTTNTTKRQIVADMESYLNEGMLRIRDPKIAREMRTFIRTGTANTMKGSPHDDLVMALGIAVRMLRFIGDSYYHHDAGTPKWSMAWWEEQQRLSKRTNRTFQHSPARQQLLQRG